VADAPAAADPERPATGANGSSHGASRGRSWPGRPAHPRSSDRRSSDRRSSDRRSSDRRSSDVVLRVVCHLAAELPIVLFGVAELVRGWRPLFDNADLALRSWQVFGPHSPLVGHQMAVSVDGHAVFGPGPLQSWILAVPDRIDPAQGVLWGGVIAVVVAVALAVEASWSVGGWPAAAVTSASVLVFALVRPELVLDVVWNVWFALLVLVCAFCSALAVASGRLRWWPVAVVSASVVVQCQAAFGPPAVGLCLAAPLLGLAVRRRRGERLGGGWWIVGLAVAAAAWVAPVVQQVTAVPGNLTLLVRAAGGSGGTIGWQAALRALGGATRLPPDWVHALPTSSPLARFFGVAGIVSGPDWWGLVVLVLLVVIAGTAWRTGRTVLAVLAALTLVLALGGLATVASIPVSQFVVLGYLGALLTPVGIAVWVTFGWAAGDAAGAALRRWRRGAGSVGDRASESDPVRPAVRAGPVVRWLVGLALVGASTGVSVTGLGDLGGSAPTLLGWPAVRATDVATAAALRVAPGGAFGLHIEGLTATESFAVESSVAYQLVTHGLDPRPLAPIGYPTFGRPPRDGPTVVVTVGGTGRTASARLERMGE